MTDFNAEPWGNTDEEGDTGYVQITAKTATADRAGAWLIGEKGASDVLSCDLSRRVREDAEPRPSALTVRLPLDCDDEWPDSGNLPIYVNVRDLLETGIASGWWEFDNIYGLTEEVDTEEWLAESDTRSVRWEAEQRRRAREDRGPWWWRVRCVTGDLLAALASRVNPADRSGAYWRDKATGEVFNIRVRGHARPVE